MAEREQYAESGPYPSKARAMALRVLDYMREKHTTWTEAELEEETSVATGASVSSIQRFKKEVREGRMQSPPPKRRKTTSNGQSG